MTIPRQHASFRGTVSYGWPKATADAALLITDTAVLTDDDADRFAPHLVRISIAGRPNSRTVDQVAAELERQRSSLFIAIGSGALLDAAKLGARRARDAGRDAALTLIPCGPEPYRAVAQFAVVDAPDGSRPTVVDPSFAACDVVVSEELLDRLPKSVLGLAMADTAVHSVESLLSRAATPYSRLLAASALRTLLLSPEPASAITAAFFAVEAFASTRLGLAHAIASPLGTRLATTHDAINAVLGDAIVDYWGRTEGAFSYVERACGATSVSEVKSLLAGLRRTAELPDSLAELGIAWEAVADVLPRAAASSGMTVLPRPVSETELEAFAARGWTGATTKEAALAEPAGAN